ncbi:MAG: adenosylcobinamide-GDP ribazoletransferase [Archaeoglobales archaeon]|nr:adenosylcobinamide-GDP ribazoletransferase [Archaeoglobales archaeon]
MGLSNILGGLKAAIAFLTTIPIEGEFEHFKRNLWMIPYVGALIGFLISIPYLLKDAGYFIPFLAFCAILIYVAIEGINHMDGLADFGDAFFAPESKKIQALKDTRTGAGGVVFLTLYLIILFHLLDKAQALDLIISQFFAKYSMLLMLVFSKPAWEGIASELMKHARKRDVLVASLPISFFIINPDFVLSALISIITAFFLKKYGEKNFGGINGDLAGAANCLSFILSLGLLQFLDYINTI